MTHEVQLVIGRGEAVKRFVDAWKARTVELNGGWLAIPVDDALADRVSKGHRKPKRGEEVGLAPPGLVEAMMEATRTGGGLAYAETMYWGGQGEQWAFAYIDGREAVAPRKTKIGAINSALRAIGVVRVGVEDEFDSIGLGLRRTMARYGEAEEQPPPPPPYVKTGDRVFVPGWMVLAAIIGAITLGVAMAILN